MVGALDLEELRVCGEQPTCIRCLFWRREAVGAARDAQDVERGVGGEVVGAVAAKQEQPRDVRGLRQLARADAAEGVAANGPGGDAGRGGGVVVNAARVEEGEIEERLGDDDGQVLLGHEAGELGRVGRGFDLGAWDEHEACVA